MSGSPADVVRRAAAHVLVPDVETPVLDEAAEHHLFRVLRLRDGEVVTVTDGAGAWRECCVVGRALEVGGEVVVVPRRQLPITIAFAIPKHDRPEWIVQKLTELGIDRIMLLHAERSVVRWDGDRATTHLAKLERVTVEALQQSRGTWLPELVGPLPALDAIAAIVVAEPGGRPLGPGDHTIAIGPEGGWSPAELAVSPDRVALGETVLRVETAALAAAVRALAHSA